MDLSTLSRDARLLYRDLIIHADDEGRLRGDPKYLKGKIFPYDDDLTVDMVRTWRDQLATIGQITLYQKDGKDYVSHPGWERWQPLRADRIKPSDLPSPTDEGSRPIERRLSSGCHVVAISPPNITEVNPTQPNSTEPNLVGTEAAKAPPSVPHEVPEMLKGLALYEANRTLCVKFPDVLPAWREAFPGVDIAMEIKRAHAWEMANPKKRKVDKLRYLNNWLAGQQDRPRGGSNAPKSTVRLNTGNPERSKVYAD